MKSSRVFKILPVVLLVAVVIYFGVQIYQYLANPFSTTLTYEAEAEDSVSVTGWVVRDEETFQTDAATLTHPLEEGQRVGMGQTFAMAYDDSQTLKTVEQIEELELQLQQLEFALTSVLDEDAALKLDSTITGSIIEEIYQQIAKPGDRMGAYISATGSAGTIAAGDFLRTVHPGIRVVATEALQCPTLHSFGFGAVTGCAPVRLPCSWAIWLWTELISAEI